MASVADRVRPGEIGRRWADRGVAAPDRSAVRRDSPVGRAHVRAAGAPPNQGRDPTLGRNRGGFSPQIHVLADRRGRPLRLTGGPRHDRTQARALGEA